MKIYRHYCVLMGAAGLAACLFLPAPAFSKPQAGIMSEWKDKLSKTGIFFRADAPRSLRNPDDPYIPVFLEIINGVEKAAHTTGSTFSRYIQRDPLKLQGVTIYVKPTGEKHKFVQEPLVLGPSKDFSFDARTDGQPLMIQDRLEKTLEVPRNLVQTYLSGHYLGGGFDSVDLRVSIRAVDWPSQDFYLRVRLNATPLPQIPNWYRGDVHYHSGFTDNPAERGYPLDVVKQAALQAGMAWLILTDHSTDLSTERYEQELEAVKKYRDGRLMFIRGEEITLSSGADVTLTTVHMVVAPSPDDPDKGFPDPADAKSSVVLSGDGSFSSSALPIRGALARVSSSGGFAFAAHPFDPISPVMRGGKWDQAVDFLAPDGKQLQAGVVGLEPWNRATMMTADDSHDPFCIQPHAEAGSCFQADPQVDQYTRLEQGIKLGWQPLLQRGLQPRTDEKNAPLFKTFLAAGSDAHGDLNFEASMDVTDFLGKPSRAVNGYAEDNALGRLFTVAYAPRGIGVRGENILHALHDGQTIASNGPLLIGGFDRNSNGSLDDPEDVGIGGEVSFPVKSMPPLQLLWVSSDEFGPYQSIRLIVGTSVGEWPAVEVPVPPAASLASPGLIPVDLRQVLKEGSPEWRYIRLEGRTRNSTNGEFRCYTNPIWIKATGD